MFVYFYEIRVLFYIILGSQYLICDVIYGLVAASLSYNAYDTLESMAHKTICF